MLKLNDTVVYGVTGVCTVEGIEEKKFGKLKRKYYVLRPVNKTTSAVFVPADNEQLLSKVKRLLSADEIKSLLHSLANEPDFWFEDESIRRVRFNEVMLSGDRRECILMMCALKNHQKRLSEKGKRLHLSDERALKEAQRLIHDEISYTMNIDFDEVSNFIAREMESAIK